MKNMKFSCDSNEHRSEIEKELFRRGFNLDINFQGGYLYTNTDRMKIYVGVNRSTFDLSTATETTLEELKAM